MPSGANETIANLARSPIADRDQLLICAWQRSVRPENERILETIPPRRMAHRVQRSRPIGRDDWCCRVPCAVRQRGPQFKHLPVCITIAAIEPTPIFMQELASRLTQDCRG